MARLETKTLALATMVVAGAFSGAAQAAEIIVNPGDPSWVSYANSGGGSSGVTNTAARSGNGSIELTGDRTRFGFGLPAPVSLSSITSFGFDWMVDPSSTSSLDPDYTPALRMHFADGELIWEGAYNGVYGSLTKGTWYVQDIIGNGEAMWQWVYGGGGANESCAGGALCQLTVSEWASDLNDPELLGISVGAGSSVGSGYLAFADNIVLGINGEETVFNFEPLAEVPEPGTLALLGAGLAGLGIARRRKRH